MSDQRDWTDLENEVGRKLPSTEEDSGVRRMSDPTPRFAQWVRNAQASADNPQRDGRFVRVVRVRGGINPGVWFEMTDGHGNFWQIRASNALLIKSPRPYRCEYCGGLF